MPDNMSEDPALTLPISWLLERGCRLEWEVEGTAVYSRSRVFPHGGCEILRVIVEKSVGRCRVELSTEQAHLRLSNPNVVQMIQVFDALGVPLVARDYKLEEGR